MKTFEAGNPIFTRESRARFRGPRAFALLLLYAALLAAATVLFYGQTFGAVQGAFWRQAPTPDKIGRELFFQLATAQLFGWMLLAPALAATAISGERERGLLDAVQLSRLAPRRIIGGKLAAVLSFIALLLPITLPMIATCFLLGGVAPAELFAAIALQLSTAFFGACLGLFFRRGRGARSLRSLRRCL